MSILQTIDLKKYYGTEPNITKALDGVNFEIYEGEFCAIVGTSGSGKSTLLNMLAGLEKPTKGEVSIAGKHIEKLNVIFIKLIAMLKNNKYIKLNLHVKKKKSKRIMNSL